MASNSNKLATHIVKHTINFTFTHSVTSNDGTKDVYVIISNVINIDVTKRISTKQTVHTAYIHIKEKFVLHQVHILHTHLGMHNTYSYMNIILTCVPLLLSLCMVAGS